MAIVYDGIWGVKGDVHVTSNSDIRGLCLNGVTYMLLEKHGQARKFCTGFYGNSPSYQFGKDVRVCLDFGDTCPHGLTFPSNVFSIKCKDTYIGNVSQFANVEELYFENCIGLKNLDGLPLSVKTITIFKCPNFETVGTFGQLETVSFKLLDNLANIDGFDNSVVANLQLTDCAQLTNVPFNQNLVNGLIANLEIVDVRPFAECFNLVISNCHNIVDVSPLSNIFNLTLQFLKGIKDITMLNTVPNLTIMSCYAKGCDTGMLSRVDGV